MKKIVTWQTCVFITILWLVALLINARFAPAWQRSQPQPAEVKNAVVESRMHQDAAERTAPVGPPISPAAAQPAILSASPPAPVLHEAQPPWKDFSDAARQVIAVDIAQRDEAAFQQTFLVKCLSVSQSARKFDGYGIHTDVVVVSARFNISTAPSANWNWTKNFEVSESIDAGQFQGLTSSDTIDRVVRTLREQIQKDQQSISNLRKAANP